MLNRLVSKRLFSSKVGFVGLGNMGLPMVRNLMKAGHSVTAFDIVDATCNVARDEGVTIKNSIGETAKGQDAVVTMLPVTADVQKAFRAPDGVFKNASKGAIVVDSSTISPLASRELMEEGAKLGFITADAPVSGGVPGAVNGTLTFMVGCEEGHFEKIKALLEAMGKNIFHCGGFGSGEIAKVCNNLALAIEMRAVAEGLALGEKLGMDPKKLSDIMSVSTGRCWSVDTYNPRPGVLEGVPASRDYEGGFGVSLIKKDLGLARESAEQVGVKLDFAR